MSRWRNYDLVKGSSVTTSPTPDNHLRPAQPRPEDDLPATRADLFALGSFIAEVVRGEHRTTREDSQTRSEALARHSQALSDRSVAEDHERRWGQW